MDIRKGKRASHPFQLIWQTIKFLFTGLIVLSFVFAANQLKLSRCFPINQVNIYGVNHTDHQLLQEVLQPLVNQGFFKVNVDYVRDRLQQLPWVAGISVTRSWPNTVDVILTEKSAIARWNDESLISETGELFSPALSSYPNNLPQLMGPDGKQIVMLEHFYKINRLLSQLHVKISYLELSSYEAWKMTLDNGMLLQVGHGDILTRLGHFVKVYPKIIGNRATDVEYVDLRYPNGLAVRWKTPVKT